MGHINDQATLHLCSLGVSAFTAVKYVFHNKASVWAACEAVSCPAFHFLREANKTPPETEVSPDGRDCDVLSVSTLSSAKLMIIPNACCLFCLHLPLMLCPLVHFLSTIDLQFGPLCSCIWNKQGDNWKHGRGLLALSLLSSSDLPHEPKWTELCEKTYRGVYNMDQTALVWLLS